MEFCPGNVAIFYVVCYYFLGFKSCVLPDMWQFKLQKTIEWTQYILDKKYSCSATIEIQEL